MEILLRFTLKKIGIFSLTKVSQCKSIKNNNNLIQFTVKGWDSNSPTVPEKS